jgi:lipopolysaccharide transport system ATP-binding protein
VVDEVLAVGDAAFQKKCLGKMSQAAQLGRTVIFVSHDMATVRRFCPRTILLDQGRISVDDRTERVVDKYLTEDLQGNAERIWPNREVAPGDALFRLQSVHVLDFEGDICFRHDIRQPVRIRIRYWNQEESRGVVPAIYLEDVQGNLLFQSHDHNRADWKTQRFQPGIYTAVCEIPGNYLTEGRFVVHVGINVELGKSDSHVLEENVVAFEVFDPCEGDSVRGPNNNYWRGLMRPMLKWTVNYQGE